MQQLEIYIENLRAILQSKERDKNEIKELGMSSLREEHELANAIYTLLCLQADLPVSLKPITTLASGAAPLFSKGYFPWGALPYPREHAEIGLAYALLGARDVAEPLARWQHLFACDHYGQPIYALFSQEQGCHFQKLKEANHALFNTCQPTLPLPVTSIDSELGLAISKTNESTVLCVASGCKSGLGSFLFRDAGIINFGPQTAPLGNCDEFGLAGRPHTFEYAIKNTESNEEGFTINYQTRLAASHTRTPPLSSLKDSGYSGLWIKAECQYKNDPLAKDSNHSLFLTLELEGKQSFDKRLMVFFAKAEACFVAGTHKLNPRSLNRYTGPASEITFQGKEGKVILRALEGIKTMEVVPLAGEGCFWGADFMVAFSYSSHLQKYVLINSCI